jgi:hypothetical protein
MNSEPLCAEFYNFVQCHTSVNYSFKAAGNEVRERNFCLLPVVSAAVLHS